MSSVLFVHNNFPGQFAFIAQRLAQRRHRVAAIGTQTSQRVPGIELRTYVHEDRTPSQCHPFARRFDAEARRAEDVLYALSDLEQGGFVPDVIVAHSGWGETLPLRASYPEARILAYSEYYYRCAGGDVDFDPEFGALSRDGRVKLLAKNAAQALALLEADAGVTPTAWQRSTFPEALQGKLTVLHEGIDTDVASPAGRPSFSWGGRRLSSDDEVVTFIARGLEPVRGFHVFMRALPQILRSRPRAQVLIVGGEEVAYGAVPDGGRTWKAVLLAEVGRDLDAGRVHFLGRVGYEDLIAILRVSTVHVYLTYPFVLSWSLLEAMSCGCHVVGSDTPPVREVVEEGRTGSLVPFFDVPALAGRVIEALARPKAFARIRANARAAVVERFDRDRICLPRMVELVEGLGSRR